MRHRLVSHARIASLLDLHGEEGRCDADGASNLLGGLSARRADDQSRSMPPQSDPTPRSENNHDPGDRIGHEVLGMKRLPKGDGLLFAGKGPPLDSVNSRGARSSDVVRKTRGNLYREAVSGLPKLQSETCATLLVPGLHIPGCELRQPPLKRSMDTLVRLMERPLVVLLSSRDDFHLSLDRCLSGVACNPGLRSAPTMKLDRFPRLCLRSQEPLRSVQKAIASALAPLMASSKRDAEYAATEERGEECQYRLTTTVTPSTDASRSQSSCTGRGPMACSYEVFRSAAERIPANRGFSGGGGNRTRARFLRDLLRPSAGTLLP